MFRRAETRSRILLNFVKPSPNNSRLLDGKRFLTDNTKIQVESPLAARYTPEEKNLILQTINTCAVEELTKYQMTEGRIKKLIANRDKNVQFTNLDEIFLLPGIDVAILDKFCRSITKDKSKTKSVSRRSSIFPPLDQDMRLMIDTCTGVWVFGNIISWAQLNMDYSLLRWDWRSLDDAFAKKDFVPVLESIAQIISIIPTSHVYVMENDPTVPFSRITSADYKSQLQRQQIVTAIVSILGTRQQRNDDPESKNTERSISNVYMLRSRAAARLFNLLIGSEIVSAESVVKQMIQGSYDVKNGVSMSIKAPIDIQEIYKAQDACPREQMNWALLLTAAFINLSIIETAAPKKTGRQRQ